MKTNYTAEMIACGTEILMGQITNTNASYIGKRLTELGVVSYYQTVVGDNPARLQQVIETGLKRSDCIIITGGLGPTEDDITMACVAKTLGIELVEDPESKAAIQAYFEKIKIEVTNNNYKQALLPKKEDGIILSNRNGTAPGAIFECQVAGKDKSIIVLPGPPNENVLMFEDQVAPYIAKRTNLILKSQYVKMTGIGESMSTHRLRHLIKSQTNPTIASYASPGNVVFRLTQTCATANDPDLLTPMIQLIQAELGEYIYEIGNRSLVEVVLDLCKEKNMTLGCAESCTGGLLSSLLTEVPGSSEVFYGGIVAYANAVKESVLGVKSETLKTVGSVSEACAREMAEGCRLRLNTDIGISITGIAGPDGGSDEKPVGIIYIGLSTKKETQVQRFDLIGRREKIRMGAVINALNVIRTCVESMCQ